MADYTATVFWQRADNEAFTDNRYSRGHEWQFDGGVTVAASSSPHVVPLPYSVEANVDPEEAFVAALSSCHMLFFLSFAAQQGFVVETYNDQAVGTMAKNSEGKVAMTRVVLRPAVKFSSDNVPTYAQLESIHHAAHEACFIANSVTSEVVTEIVEV